MPNIEPTSSAPSQLDELARAFGCPPLVHLDKDVTFEQLDYLDLLPGRTDVSPNAIAEFEGRPVLYLLNELDGTNLSTAEISNLQRVLANRSEHSCLAIVKPGHLEVYPVNIDRTRIEDVAPEIVAVNDPKAPTFFHSLATGNYVVKGQPTSSDFVFDEIHRLMAVASEALIGALPALDVLSIMGRALFFRFLVDRQIVRVGEIEEVCPFASGNDLRDVFSDAEKASATSAWLDETFNGDLLPLVPGLSSETDTATRRQQYTRYFKRAGKATDGAIFLHLQAILRGWRSLGGNQFQFPLAVDWDDLDFAHIPVGVLSQVYETFSRQWDSSNADTNSVHYTPKQVARLIVSEALAAVSDPTHARILDPACGGGIFLVLAFRELIRKHWESSKRRPSKDVIHHVLYKQLCGFDVSESALRLTALALYITAIELNGTTRPPKILKVPHALKNKVLFNFGAPADVKIQYAFQIGSLSSSVPSEFDGTFDAVIGNPPWTRLRPTAADKDEKRQESELIEALDRQFTSIGRRVLAKRGLEHISKTYKNPDKNPDLPFVWRAMEWAKLKIGVIAFALPGRLILKQAGPGKLARDAIFQSLTVTGILNGADLEKTSVWPKMDLPFLVLFGRNEPPPPDYHFHFLTPLREDSLAAMGGFRLDYQSAQPVSAQSVIDRPWLLKALGTGTVLDVEVQERLTDGRFRSLRSVWEELELPSGVGYKIAAELAQKSADHLFDLPDFVPPADFDIDADALETWWNRQKRTTAHSPGPISLYAPPLVIIPQAPGEDAQRPRAYLAPERRICFSQSYYGYSAAGHLQGETLTSLLYLVAHSKLFRHFCLMRSSRIGASYRTFIKEDLDAFPFPHPALLTEEQRLAIKALASALRHRGSPVQDELDKFIFDLYSIDDDDIVVITDTLSVEEPYRSVRQHAMDWPGKNEVEQFAAYMCEMLQPFFEVTGQKLRIEPCPVPDPRTTWRFLVVATDACVSSVPQALICALMEAASKTAASRVVMALNDGRLLIGLLNRKQFWTRSRARLCALHVSDQWLDTFPVPLAA